MIFSDNKKRKSFVIYSAFASLIFLAVPFVCYASVSEVVNLIVGWLANIIVNALGWVSMQVIYAIITIAPYNKFIQEPSITQAWGVVRDFSNMWFILILLVIAFATILRIETYNMKRWLPKLLIMAVLINFSKTICGVMIDFSQVIMLTFVNAFAQSGGSFVDVTQMQKMLSISSAGVNSTGSTVGAVVASQPLQIVVAYVLACVFMLIACVTLLAILIVFVMRIIMLWILVALSPIAFMLSSFPQGQSYASRYWGEFTKYLINGPVLAFFIWLSLSVMNSFQSSQLSKDLTTNLSNSPSGSTGITTPQIFIPFVMAIGFLVGGLMISQQIGGIGASWGMGAVRNLGSKGMNMAKGAFIKAPLTTAKFLGNAGLDHVSKWVGVDLNVGRTIAGVKSQMRDNTEKRESEVRESVLNRASKGGVRGAAAHISTGDLAWESLTSLEGNKSAARRLFKGDVVGKAQEKLKVKREERKDIWSEKEGEEWYDKTSKADDDYKKAQQNTAVERQKLKELPKGSADREKQQAILEAAEAKEAELKGDFDILEKSRKPIRTKEAKVLDDGIADLQKVVVKNKIPGIDVALSEIDAKRRSRAKPNVPTTDNADELNSVAQAAAETGDKGLAMETWLKMVQKGDHNEILSHYNCGTGKDGLLRFADILEKQYNFDRQMAYKFIAQIGGIAKGIGHFSAYGAVKQEDGRWRASSDEEWNTAMLSEMMKVDPQKMMRDYNRLMAGFYTSGSKDHETRGFLKAEDHNGSNFQLTDAYQAYIRLQSQRGEPFAKIVRDRGNQNLVEYSVMNIDNLVKVGVNPLTVEAFKEGGSGEGTNVALQIQKVKRLLEGV